MPKSAKARQTLLPTLPQVAAGSTAEQVLQKMLLYTPSQDGKISFERIDTGGQPQTKTLLYVACDEKLMHLKKFLCIQTGKN
jgi:hypothetical protein